MAEYRRGAHTVYEIHLHLVWTTKYRKPVLVGDAAARVRDLIREICGTHDVKIMKGHVSKDHVHLLVSIPPQVTISRLLQWLKGKTAHKIILEFPHIKKHYWGQHMWARGYFCCKHGERDRRDYCGVLRTPAGRSGRRFQSRRLSPSTS